MRVRHAFNGPSDLVLPWIPEVFFIEGVHTLRKTTYIITDFGYPFDSWIVKQMTHRPTPPFGINERHFQLIVLQVRAATSLLWSQNLHNIIC